MTVAAIVGHGKSPGGKGWGTRIDACDFVFRLFDWEWQSTEDYGRKYDFGFYCASYAHINCMPQRSKARPTIAWIAEPVIDEHQTLAVATLKPPPPTHIIEAMAWRKIGRELGGDGCDGRFTQSRGTLTACWAIEYVDPGSTVVLVGFDNVREHRCIPLKDAVPPEYLALPHVTVSYSDVGYPRENGQTKYRPHDFAVEEGIIQAVAAQNEVKVFHAQDIW
jgi:hypothetical protein